MVKKQISNFNSENLKEKIQELKTALAEAQTSCRKENTERINFLPLPEESIISGIKASSSTLSGKQYGKEKDN